MTQIVREGGDVRLAAEALAQAMGANSTSTVSAITQAAASGNADAISQSIVQAAKGARVLGGGGGGHAAAVQQLHASACCCC